VVYKVILAHLEVAVVHLQMAAAMAEVLQVLEIPEQKLVLQGQVVLQQLEEYLNYMLAVEAVEVVILLPRLQAVI
jgi:hypothetical protein